MKKIVRNGQKTLASKKDVYGLKITQNQGSLCDEDADDANPSSSETLLMVPLSGNDSSAISG
jgi:hypothetical protein